MEMPELKLLPTTGITWIPVGDMLPDIITNERMLLVYTPVNGTSVAFWNKRSGKFLDESMGFEFKHITHWAYFPDGPDDT